MLVLQEKKVDNSIRKYSADVQHNAPPLPDDVIDLNKQFVLKCIFVNIGNLLQGNDHFTQFWNTEGTLTYPTNNISGFSQNEA
jgi:hypothetical protein